MELFLVRHGQTGGNVAKRHQVEHTPLTPEGREQARKIGEELRDYRPTHLITSNLVRAVETAREIGSVCDLIPETSNAFIELQRPKWMYGHFHKSPLSMFFYMRWYMGLVKESDDNGESYVVLRERILKAQAILATYPDDARVVVVSHSVFINFFLAHMCQEKAMTPLQAARSFHRIVTMKNTHMIPVLYDATRSPHTCSWIINN